MCPAGGEFVIGDGGALMGQRPEDEIRAAIREEAMLDVPDEYLDYTTAQTVLAAAVQVAVAREAQARELRDQEIRRRDDEIDRLNGLINAVQVVCDAGERQATRWEQPFPVPAWVSNVRAALGGKSDDQ